MINSLLQRLFLVSILAVAAVHPAEAKVIERSLAWSALPADLVGKKVKVQTAAGRKESGRVTQVNADGLTLAGKPGSSQTLARGDVRSIEWSTRKGSKWTAIGAGVGAAPGAFLTWWAVLMKRNEGGIYSDRNIGIAAAIMGAGAVLGALGGRGSDADRHIVTITGP